MSEPSANRPTPDVSGPGTDKPVDAHHEIHASQVWNHIKRSWIVQWTAAYCAAAFLVFDCLEIAGHAFEWPAMVSHVGSILLILGIPINAIFSWYHGEQARKRVSGPELLIIVLLLVTIGSVWKLLERSGQEFDGPLGPLLSKHDHVIFYGSRTDNYEIARVLHNQAVLREDTQLSKEIGGARSSFYLMANTAGTILRSHEPEFEEALMRGVHIRFLLSDFSHDNEANFNGFATTVGESPAQVKGDGEKSREIVEQLKEKVKRDKRAYPGDLEIRWFAKPIFYTAWIRDGATVDGIAHLSIHMYRTKNDWPSFRFGRDAKYMVESLRLDYENLWESARTAPGTGD